MMRSKCVSILSVAVALCLFVILGADFEASTGPTFQVKPVYPENQQSRSGYFDLRVVPGQVQDLTLLVINSHSEDIQVEVEALDASTAPDGFIDYATSGVRDETLDIAFSDLAAVPQSVVSVPGNGQAEVTVSYKAPDAPFPGMILGGIRVLKRSEAPSDAMIVNEYQYALAVALTSGDEPVEPDFALIAVDSGLENYRAAVTATVRNPKPLAVKHAEVFAALRQQGSDEAVFSLEKTVDMAPHSVWELPMVDQAGYGFAAGSYTYYLRIQLDDRIWEFEEPLVISTTEAQAMNNNAVNQQQQRGAGFPLWAIALIVCGLLLLIIVIILMLTLLRRNARGYR